MKLDLKLDLPKRDKPETEEEPPRKRKKRAKALTLKTDYKGTKQGKKLVKKYKEIGTTQGELLEESETTETTPMTQETGQGSEAKKTMTVTLEYDKNSSRMMSCDEILMECVEDLLGKKSDPRSHGIDYWWRIMDTVGNVPFRTVFIDDDRYYQLIYAAGYIKKHGTPEDETKAITSRPPSNPDYDPYVPNIAQEGRSWGIRMEKPPLHPKIDELAKQQEQVPVPVPVPAPVAPLEPESEPEPEVSESRADILERSRLTIPKYNLNSPSDFDPEPEQVTVKEQVEAKEKHDLHTFLGSQNDMKQLEAIRDTAPDVYVQKWAIAERLARKPREAWENAPYELVKMTEFCYGWLRQTTNDPEGQRVPYYPKDLVEVWWKRPDYSVINLTPEAVQRRDSIVERIRSFWNKSVEKAADKINVRSDSYRVTLAAMNLEALIEKYANGEEIENDIRQAALRYFQAHFPIELSGVKPGPIDTLDPDYTDYIKLCQKYNIPHGTLLHEANL